MVNTEWTVVLNFGKYNERTVYPSRAQAAKSVALHKKCMVQRDNINSTYTVLMPNKDK